MRRDRPGTWLCGLLRVCACVDQGGEGRGSSDGRCRAAEERGGGRAGGVVALGGRGCCGRSRGVVEAAGHRVSGGMASAGAPSQSNCIAQRRARQAGETAVQSRSRRMQALGTGQTANGATGEMAVVKREPVLSDQCARC